MFIFRSWELKKTPINKIYSYSTILSVVTIFTGLFSISFFDQKITYYFKDDDWKWLFAREITNIGLFSNYFIAALTVLAICLYLIKLKRVAHPKVYSFYRKSQIMIYSLLFSGLCLQFFKFLFGRQRPKISPDFDPHAFYPFSTHWNFHSMPSGHTQVLFCVATFFSYYYPQKKYFFYLLATALSFTRVMTRDHFFADILIGALVGHLTCLWLFYFLSRKASKVLQI